MTNFDENHPDVFKIHYEYYDPALTPWTVEMERVVLQFLISQIETIERGAKNVAVSMSVPLIKSALEVHFRNSPALQTIHARIYEMKDIHKFCKGLLSADGVFVDEERGFCLDTTINNDYIGGDVSHRYYLYDMPPLWNMMVATLGMIAY